MVGSKNHKLFSLKIFDGLEDKVLAIEILIPNRVNFRFSSSQ